MTAINQDPKVMEYFPALKSEAETRSFIDGNKALQAREGYCLYAVEIKDTKQFIGFVGLSPVDSRISKSSTVEIGWRVASEFWGKGYASEAAQVVMEHAGTKLGIKELVSFTTTDNFRSSQLMRRLGFTHYAEEDFDHPRIEDGHKLQRHVFYRKKL
jgi:RimJ/RimL family protein N-acetyltransferase